MHTRALHHFPLCLLTVLLAACTATAPEQNSNARQTENAQFTLQPSQAKSHQGSISSIGHGNDIGAYIQIMDLNKDGVVTLDEVQAQRMQQFQVLDANRDGKVSMKEYTEEFRQRIQRSIEADRREIDRMTDMRFESLAGKESHISRARYDQASERAYGAFIQGKMPEKLARQTSGKGQNKKTQRNGGMLIMPTNHTKAGMMALYDQNRDGKITREEFDQVREDQFKRTDSNRDGRLSRDEYATEFDQRVNARQHEVVSAQMRQARVRFGILDADKSDFIELQELIHSGKQMFQRIDRNGDGRVDQADASLFASKRNAEAGKGSEKKAN
ncbi:MAG: hypothetical protein Q4A28_04185 [Brachymonas sp.]|nr:hypothetical protein [Brachymonas sp.]